MDCGWEFWVDRGGTFTDVVARDPEGRIQILKLLSDNPDHYADAPLHAIRQLMGIDTDTPLPNDAIHSVKMGTTLATNALLERKGARVGLLVTKGFADLLEIGYQDRPDIFALRIEKPETLYAEVREIGERVMADGTVRTPLHEESVNEALADFREAGVEAIAILFIHSYAFPEHERQAGALARTAGFTEVSLSHEVAREIKAVGRGDTATTNAYLNPLLRRYVENVRQELGAAVPLRFMQSNGGLTDADRFIGKNAVLSGPAGGVVAYAHTCKQAGFHHAIGFDMGGTSTDVSRHDGAFERVFEKRVAGVRLKAPMLHIETVAAGGGSILRFDGQRFLVGPESAGARPGPACYRLGGPATVTDANLVLGRIQPAYFPNCFGPSGDAPLDVTAARSALEALTARVNESAPAPWSVAAVAAGFIRVANENMVQPIKKISVACGYDVREYALACFGGAGAQHACAVAGALGIAKVMLHPHAGVLSAYGMGLADMIHTEVEAVLDTLGPDGMAPYGPRFSELEAVGRDVLEAEGFTRDRIEQARSADLRYAGVDTFLNIPDGPDDDVAVLFEAHHAALYGFVKAGHPVEIVNVRTETIGHTDKPAETRMECKPHEVPVSLRVDRVAVYFATGSGAVVPVDTPVYRRADLKPGDRVSGPALIVEAVSTIVVDPGWEADVNGYNHLILTAATAHAMEPLATDCDPVMLEVFNSLFMSIAEQMGKTLERVSHSANIKERLDFSCAVFSPDGELVANAPHMPVHLGAMGESVRAILDERSGSMKAGDVYMTNDPYHGGSHLPDITLVTPVMGTDGSPAFFVANRGHHADIGGITPGSMPPFSTCIEEEGVVIHNFTLVSEGVFHEEAIVRLLTEHPYPARNIDERLSDLRAQIASNNAGALLLEELRVQYGAEVVQAYMGHVRDNAAEAMRNRLTRLPDGEYRAEDRLDSGAKIVCRIVIAGDTASVDFSGTDSQLEGNLNAPPAVAIAAVLYVFRTLIEHPIPLNAGCLDPISIHIPEGSLLAPRSPAAVVGGNVETSVRIVDTLYAALGTIAGGQGTMNNLTFGTEEWGYYETICGGAGAGPGFDGASAVHTHMTNTRITDPEVLERRYPVLLREFSIRKGSGGRGEFCGGDGTVRAIEFLKPMAVGVLSERRVLAPYGLNGGAPGATGRNLLLRDGDTFELEGHARLDVQKGDVLVIETPGGGGYGRPSSTD